MINYALQVIFYESQLFLFSFEKRDNRFIKCWYRLHIMIFLILKKTSVNYIFLTELIISHILKNAYSKKKYTFKFFIIMEHQLYIWDKNFSMKTLFTWIIHYLMLLQWRTSNITTLFHSNFYNIVIETP